MAPSSKTVMSALHKKVFSLKVILLVIAILSIEVQAGFDARLKWFGSATALPEQDLQRDLKGTPVLDTNIDLRLMFKKEWSSFSLKIDHTTLYQQGDSLNFTGLNSGGLEQQTLGNKDRLIDLTSTIDSGRHHRVLQGIDRLALKYHTGKWGITVGREAITWGGGMVFQPMDLFNPFSPTAVDRDYKAGDDLILVERLLQNGSNLQVLGVARQNDSGSFSGASSSLAAKYHGFIDIGEYEVLAARHFSQEVYGFSLRWPLAGAMFRSDVVATRLDGGDWKLMTVANLDYSMMLSTRSLYLFIEYFHNDYGMRQAPSSIEVLPRPLIERLERGELFNVMRDYIAIGANIQWHPLITQSLTVISNVGDGSMLVQSQIGYEISDQQRVQMGIVLSAGSRGSEFKGLPAFENPIGGKVLTVGGGTRGYLRWIYYF